MDGIRLKAVGGVFALGLVSAAMIVICPEEVPPDEPRKASVDVATMKADIECTKEFDSLLTEQQALDNSRNFWTEENLATESAVQESMRVLVAIRDVTRRLVELRKRVVVNGYEIYPLIAMQPYLNSQFVHYDSVEEKLLYLAKNRGKWSVTDGVLRANEHGDYADRLQVLHERTFETQRLVKVAEDEWKAEFQGMNREGLGAQLPDARGARTRTHQGEAGDAMRGPVTARDSADP